MPARQSRKRPELTRNKSYLKVKERKHKASAEVREKEIAIVHGRLKKNSEMNTGYKVK